MTPVLSVKELMFKRRSNIFWRSLFERSRRKRQFAVGPINFEIKPGETLSVIGENGSGKSTIANLLVGVENPTSGSILLNGQKLQQNNMKQRSLNIRMIFQQARESLNPAVTVGSLLEEPLKLNSDLNAAQRQEKIQKTLKQVGLLAEHAHFYRHMLSDGQTQRVALARALILNPQVIVADEPFAALDPSVRSQMVNLLIQLQNELGLSFIFISHNLGIVRHVSDRILVVKEGQIVESGDTNTIFNWPKTEYTQKLISAYRTMVENRIF